MSDINKQIALELTRLAIQQGSSIDGVTPLARQKSILNMFTNSLKRLQELDQSTDNLSSSEAPQPKS
jgi:hypothetical protein